ncbi:MAG TPA: thioredoxin family protein, partial [Flavisolibacter sp.]|nr:thioredoxin family protein [Flavisolibacter sp.]
MRILFLLCFFITGYFGFAQTPFQELSFEESLKESQKKGRLIFIQYESTNCGQCNEVANKSFENPELAELLSNTFVCLRISPTHQDREQVGALYSITPGMGSLFIDQNKTLIHSYRMTTSRASDYVSQINRVLAMAGESLKMSELDQEYKKGNRYLGFMELYLQRRATLNLTTDQLLEEYIGLLPADSLRSIRTIVFIAQMSPLLGSNADKALRKDREIFSRAWYSMPNQQRIKINSSIIRKSKNKAVQEKD